MRTKLLLLLALALVACGQSVLGGDCDYTKNQRFVDTEGKEWVCRQIQTWTPAETGLSNLDKKAERRETPPILRRFLLGLFSMAVFFWSVENQFRYRWARRFTPFTLGAYIGSIVLVLLSWFPWSWGWWL